MLRRVNRDIGDLNSSGAARPLAFSDRIDSARPAKIVVFTAAGLLSLTGLVAPWVWALRTTSSIPHPVGSAAQPAVSIRPELSPEAGPAPATSAILPPQTIERVPPPARAEGPGADEAGRDPPQEAQPPPQLTGTLPPPRVEGARSVEAVSPKIVAPGPAALPLTQATLVPPELVRTRSPERVEQARAPVAVVRLPPIPKPSLPLRPSRIPVDPAAPDRTASIGEPLKRSRTRIDTGSVVRALTRRPAAVSERTPSTIRTTARTPAAPFKLPSALAPTD